jgi:hypothetical protein
VPQQLSRREFLCAASLPFLHSEAESCILINLTGGPSQLDTWDLKPEAPSAVRGPFRPIRTNVPGVEIGPMFPLMARRAHLYTLVRSVYQTAEARHTPAFSGGIVLRGSFGLARSARLVERGERRVTVNMAGSWDAHGWGRYSSIAAYANSTGPLFDREFSLLLDRLDNTGLLARTLVIAMGEFGRTPRINPSGGRDHWPHCRTAILAGGGIRGGEVWGSSDRFGAEPRDFPVHADSIRALADRFT